MALFGPRLLVSDGATLRVENNAAEITVAAILLSTKYDYVWKPRTITPDGRQDHGGYISEGSLTASSVLVTGREAS